MSSTPLDALSVPLSGVALIEAAAGTGKTWTICALALRVLTEQERDIRDLLIVTFTNAATAELRERVRNRLKEALDWLENPTGRDDSFLQAFADALKERGVPRDTACLRLRTALSAFDEAAIFTIHGFCQRALNEHPFAAAQPFEQELGNIEALVRQATLDYWRRFIAHGALSRQTVAQLLRCKPGKTGKATQSLFLTPERLETLLARALQKPMARPLWPENLPPFPAEPKTSPALEVAFQMAKQTWQTERQAILQVLQAHQPHLHATYYGGDKIMLGAREWDDFFAFGDLSPDLPEPARFRDSFLKGKTRKGKAPPEHPFFRQAEALYVEKEAQEQATAALCLALIRHFLEWGAQQVETERRQRRLVDFDHLLTDLQGALNSADGEVLAAQLRERYPVALIDEFQDTDPVQFDIFRRIYGIAPEAVGENSTVFFVGDPKQAIYSFRQADLHTYFKARRCSGRHYALNDNQRSQPGVIAGVNVLFGQNPHAFMLEELEFSSARRGQKPLPEFVDESGVERAAFHFLALPDVDEQEEKGERTKETREIEAAQATANEIARLLDAARQNRIRIGGKPLAPERIAVLVRVHRQGQRVRAELGKLGVRASERSTTSVFKSQEAEDCERFLHALSEPFQRGLMNMALSTTLIGLNAVELDALEKDEAALGIWTERFYRWRRHWQTRGIAAMLVEASRELRLPVRLLAMSDGERRLTNLLHLSELLHQMEMQTPQPARLLRAFVRERRKTGGSGDDAHLLRLESDRDLIQIVTIHGAKGLEYDIVFCPFLWDDGKPRNHDLPGMAYHDEQGDLVFDFRPDAEARATETIRRETAEEALRLAYVALTRAVHRCYLVFDPTTPEGLLNWLAAGGDFSPEIWLKKWDRKNPLVEPDALRVAWQKLIETAEGSMETLPLPAFPKPPPGPESPERLQAFFARFPLVPGWRIDSFSGLISTRAVETAETADHDAFSSAATLPAPAGLAANDILRFPRGPRAGDVLHALFEHADFSNPERGIDESLLRQLRPLAGEAAPEMCARLLRDVFATPLMLPGAKTPLMLRDLPAHRRFMELEFHLPVDRLEAPRLAALMAAHDEPLPPLRFERLNGFLSGFIDMVFAHENRFYVLDWKSNHLGWTPAAYDCDALAQAMQAHGYHLQARLYLLALHRLLKFRLPDYDPATHLGGACYLFLRGARPDWRQADGTPSGAAMLPPKVALVQAMEALIQD